MTKTKEKRPKPAKPDPKAYVLYGTDEYAKPRGARFSSSEPEPLAKAAEAMGLRMLEVTGPKLADLAKRLPKGRLHASGRGFVPSIKGDLYLDLVAVTILDDWQPPANPDLPAQDLPRTWDEIGPGHLVIAKQTLECGWWEAVVIERNGDLVTLRYRDYPNYPNLVRHRTAVALINLPNDPAT
jgi:hypothetical protein